MVKRKEIKYGDIRYVSGTSTKVKVIDRFDSDNPLCLILEAGQQSKFTVGVKYPIWRRNLWPYCGQPNGIMNAWKKKHRGWIEK